MSVVAVLASLLFLMGWKPAAQSSPYAAQHIDRREVTIGDRIHFRIQVFTERDQTVVVPKNVPLLNTFVVKSRDINEKRRRERGITTIEYELVSYDVGWDTIPRMECGVVQGDDTMVVSTEAVPIEIKSVAPNMTGQEDIRRLRPQIGMKMPIWQYLLLLGTMGFMVAAALFFLWRRRRAIVPEEVPQRPPWEVAIAALEQLSQREASSPEDVRRFYTKISYILRAYYEGRFLFPAVEHTTTEIMQRVKRIKELRPYIDQTDDFLMKSDLVKFAKYMPGSVDSQLEIGLVREIVEFTKEKEEEEEKETVHV